MGTKGTDAIDYLGGYQDGKQAGIKEVVEWLDRNWLYVLLSVEGFGESWEQAKLKEWDIGE